MRKHIRRQWLAVLVLLGAIPAMAEQTYKLDIAPQSLNSALQRFAEQSGLQVVYYTKIAEGHRTARIAGTLSADEALKKLLEGTELTFQSVNADTVAIRTKGAKSTSSGSAAADQMRLARVDEDARGGQGPANADGASRDSAQMVVQGDRGRPAPFSTENLDLTRTEDDVLPFQVFTAREIELSGVSSLQEFLQTQLPQNFNMELAEERNGNASGMGALTPQVDMRGWGATETVFLLNGRRMPNEYTGFSGDTSNATPNLRIIPLASIERIEILSSAGSAIYGANATGGVINIITRQDFAGGQVFVSYATPADVNAPKRNVEMNYGFALTPRVRLTVNAGYSDSQAMRAGDRSGVTIERWRARAPVDSNGRIIDVMGSRGPVPLAPYGGRPNIRPTSNSGDLFSTIPGSQLFGHPRAGYAGGGSVADFETGLALELAEGTAGNSRYAKGSVLGPDTSNVAFRLGTEVRLNERWNWSVDSRYARTEAEGRPDASILFNDISATAVLPTILNGWPNNPFGQNVQVYLVDSGLDRPELRGRPTTETLGLNTTLRGEMGEWRGFLDLGFSHNHNESGFKRYYEPTGGWRDALMTGRYNPFVDISRVAAASGDFYEHYTIQHQDFASSGRSYSAAIKASGPLFRLNGNAVQLTVGLDGSRGDRYGSNETIWYENAATGAVTTPVGTTNATIPRQDNNPARRFIFNSYAGYAEITAPLISAAQGVRWVRGLEIFGSGRLDYTVRDGFSGQSLADQQAGVPPVPVKYTDSTHLHAVGFKYEAMEGMALRVSRSIGFIPPSVTMVTPGLPSDFACCFNVPDPRRDDEVISELSTTMFLTGGNPDLEAENTESTNLGVILSPVWAPGLRVSVDYIESVRNNAIFSFSASSAGLRDALALENDFPGLITRSDPDGHPSGVGLVALVDFRQRNLRMVASKSVDFSIEQRLPEISGGRLSLNINASKNLSYKVQNSNNAPAQELIRQTILPQGSAFPRQIVWNGNAQLRWDSERWGFGWSARYRDYLLMSAPNLSTLATIVAGQGSDRVPWKLDHDVNMSYRSPVVQNPRGLQWFLSGTSITFTVKNVFDRTPRFYFQDTDYGVAPGDSIMGRTVTLGIRKDL